MTYWISAKTIDDEGREYLTEWVEADSFEEACEQLAERARHRWPGRAWKETSVTEQPPEAEAGPVALLLDLTSAHRAARRAA